MDANEGLKRAWHARDRLYQEMFGPSKFTLPKKYEPPTDLDTAAISGPIELAVLSGTTLKVKDINIVAHEPNELRPYWTFATSGLSNPWFGQSEDVSGFGCEFVLKTKMPGRWAIKLLRRIVYYIISYSGTLSPGVMLRIDAPLFPEDKSDLGGFVVWYVDEAPECIYQLPSGQFGVFSIIGITSDECNFVESIGEYGCWSIQQILREAGYEQLTEPLRESLMKSGDIEGKMNSLRNYLQNFGFSTGADA
jgi:hypothetical protein